jgi:high-affinity K+ transport system ATPase subunit B
MKYKLTSIEPVHLGWFAGLVTGAITFVTCVCIGLALFVMGSVEYGGPRAAGLFPTLMMVFGLPVFYGGGGLIVGYVVARVFNLAAKRFGGIDITLE